MDPDRFRIVFEKLSCDRSAFDADERLYSVIQRLVEESDEIAELRRVTLEMSKSEAITYSST
jgi:hypothetical protein